MLENFPFSLNVRIIFFSIIVLNVYNFRTSVRPTDLKNIYQELSTMEKTDTKTLGVQKIALSRLSHSREYYLAY
jgi:hypothetical protein